MTVTVKVNVYRHARKPNDAPDDWAPDAVFTQQEQTALLEHVEGATRESMEVSATKLYAAVHGACRNVNALLTAAPSLWSDLHIVGTEIGLTGFQAIMERLDRLEQPGPAPAAHYNERVQVHVPGLGLLLINEVVVETDLCTEKLQNLLNDGWRIIAACPQPNQRRPDYVLGKTV